MGSEWGSHKLEDCLAALIDYRGKTPHKVESGIPLVTAKIVKAGRIEAPTEYISEEDYTSWMTRGFPAIGDVVMTTEAPLGEVGQIHELPVALAQRVVTLRGKEGVLDSHYLLYALQSEGMQARLRDRSSGTTVLGIKQSELRKVEIELPPIEHQREVANALGCVDDRIDLLRETNTTLEAIAQALFKSWFVDFDPVRAKAEGREPEGMDAAIATLFPSEFEESELGLIPKGWQVGTVDDLLVLQRGFDLPSGQRIPGNFPILAASGPSGTHERAMAAGPGVTTGRSGVLGRVYFVLDDFWPLNTSLWIKEFRRCTPTYAYQFLRTLDLFRLNAGSAVPTLNRNHVHGVPAVLPPPEVVTAYDRIAVALLSRVKANIDWQSTLGELRDTLLPRLISGKLRLPEAVAAIAEVVA